MPERMRFRFCPPANRTPYEMLLSRDFPPRLINPVMPLFQGTTALPADPASAPDPVMRVPPFSAHAAFASVPVMVYADPVPFFPASCAGTSSRAVPQMACPLRSAFGTDENTASVLLPEVVAVLLRDAVRIASFAGAAVPFVAKQIARNTHSCSPPLSRSVSPWQ